MSLLIPMKLPHLPPAHARKGAKTQGRKEEKKRKEERKKRKKKKPLRRKDRKKGLTGGATQTLLLVVGVGGATQTLELVGVALELHTAEDEDERAGAAAEDEEAAAAQLFAVTLFVAATVVDAPEEREAPVARILQTLFPTVVVAGAVAFAFASSGPRAIRDRGRRRRTLMDPGAPGITAFATWAACLFLCLFIRRARPLPIPPWLPWAWA